MKTILTFLVILLFISHQGYTQIQNRFEKEPWLFEAMEKNKIEVRIYVKFVVDTSGKVIDDSVKAANTFFGLEKVAEKMIINAPNKYTQNVKRMEKNQRFAIPIDFKLDIGNKDWSEFHRIKAKKFLEINDTENAKRHLEESVKLNKKNANSYYLLGQIWKEVDGVKSDKYLELASKYGFKE